MFDTALKKSSVDDNEVLTVADKLRVKGYRPKEIYDVLSKLRASLIEEDEREIVGQALEEFGQYVDLDGEDG